MREPPPEIARWYCVRTGLNAEYTAPTVWKAAISPRRNTDGSIRRGKPDRVEPLFPRYLFCHFHRLDDDWRRIWGFEGVDRIFSSSPDSPIPVPDQAIELLRSFAAPNGCIYPADRYALPLAVGTSVRLLSGPMEDLTGICEWSSGKRVGLLMQILGRSVVVAADRTAVEVAA
jgi:transcriptional antiterminator RfaH